MARKKNKPKPFYSAAELAQYFEVRPGTVHKWVQRGDLRPHHQVQGPRGPMNVFHEDDVKALAQKRYGA